MGCCCSSEGGGGGREEPADAEGSEIAPGASGMEKIEASKEALNTEFISNHGPEKPVRSQVFTFEELYEATGGFRADLFLGEGGFGRVYKGVLDATNQEVAIKILNLQGNQGTREFLTEVLMLSTLHHPNLVKLVGYCADGNQRLLVYEYMPLGSLKSHIHDLSPDKRTLDWNTRMKILAGAAKGLQHLHVRVDPPVINRDVKCENILLGEGYHPKLSDFGLAKLGPTGDDTHVSTRVMGTPGYCAPEYLMSGQLTLKSDIYSFGVVMLEVITGRKAIDDGRCKAERNLTDWAIPLVTKKDYPKLADPALCGQYSLSLLYRALVVAKLCVNKTASQRPQIEEVVNVLTQISESQFRSARRSANQHSRSPSTPIRMSREYGNQAEDQGECS